MLETLNELTMNARTTNIIGIVLTILAGVYFMIMYCDACRSADATTDTSQTEVVHLN